MFNNGEMERDFTYIDDIVNGVTKIIEKNIDSREHYKIYNIGNNKTESLQDFITTIEEAIGKKAIKEMYPMQQGDVPKTFADVDELIKDYKYSPSTDIKSGIISFVDWFKFINKIKDNFDVKNNENIYCRPHGYGRFSRLESSKVQRL